MRLLSELDKIIIELIEDIFLYGADSPGVLYTSREDSRMLVDYNPKVIAHTENIYFDENREEATLFRILCRFVSAKKYRELERVPPKAAILITAARLTKRITQEELAAAVGIPVRSIRDWERGVRNPKINALIKILKYCNITIDADMLT